MTASLLDLTRRPGSAPAADWLIAHLQATGHLTANGIGRRARPHTCRCGNTILAGLDDDTTALEARVDPWPLTPLGEALACIEGRATYALHHHGGRYVLDWRTATRITHQPAGTRTRMDVLRQHRCDTPPPAGQLIATSTFGAPTDGLPAGSPPPF